MKIEEIIFTPEEVRFLYNAFWYVLKSGAAENLDDLENFSLKHAEKRALFSAGFIVQEAFVEYKKKWEGEDIEKCPDFKKKGVEALFFGSVCVWFVLMFSPLVQYTEDDKRITKGLLHKLVVGPYFQGEMEH